jgi:hypothetical protein
MTMTGTELKRLAGFIEDQIQSPTINVTQLQYVKARLLALSADTSEYQRGRQAGMDEERSRAYNSHYGHDMGQ